jgi:HAD superfamily hydrolase (TIGR01509 family)
MTGRIPVPVFDIGNVLIRWDPRLLYRKLIAEEGELDHFLTHVCAPEWNLEMDAGKSFAQGVAERVALHPDKADLIRAFDERWTETMGGLIEGSVAILEELRTKGIKTYAISNFSGEKFVVASCLYPFLALFDGVIISGQEGILKPDARIFRLLCQRYGLAPGDCFFIDDSATNVAAARAEGMQAHLFQSPEGLRNTMREAGFPLS